MKQISIIIPVYNAESTIKNTLESLLQQTYKNIEIVCVDDGSSDDSLRILNDYSNAYPERIKVIHQENKGVSVARNTGIDAANGEILMFVDADDNLTTRACERISEVFRDGTIEVFTFGFVCRPEEAMPLGMSKELRPPEKTYSHFHPDLLFKDKSRPYICRTAVTKQLIYREHIRFEPDITLGEDQIIYFLLYPLANKIALSPEQLYIYNMNNESATHSNANDAEGSLKKLQQHMLVVETILREWKQRGLEKLCQAELLNWVLDFVMFDINALDKAERQKYFTQLYKSLYLYFGTDLISVPRSWSVKNCLKDIMLIAQLSTLQRKKRSKIRLPYLATFYLHRYGFVRCIQQVLIGLNLLRKWK